MACILSIQASNSVGTSKRNTVMHIIYGPLFRSLPKDVASESGKKAVLQCDVDSNPPPVIQWYEHGSRKLFSIGKNLEVIVTPSTSGTYICVASVRGFPNLEGRLRVLVKGPPLIVSPNVQEGKMGETVTLECTTVSIPKPIRVNWTYKGRQIDTDDSRYEIVEETLDNALRNLLVIHGAEKKDFGPYNCSVINEYGITRKLITLNQESK
ncbi:hypothetical protein SK128_013535 [Halocaridina rubra]|uniref:Ig-like domain-containing protein n=1 Tax=Halocaridina rubra TaxID=373956 RepID=A0AAN9ADT7_HALRR